MKPIVPAADLLETIRDLREILGLLHCGGYPAVAVELGPIWAGGDLSLTVDTEYAGKLLNLSH